MLFTLISFRNGSGFSFYVPFEFGRGELDDNPRCLKLYLNEYRYFETRHYPLMTNIKQIHKQIFKNFL